MSSFRLKCVWASLSNMLDPAVAPTPCCCRSRRWRRRRRRRRRCCSCCCWRRRRWRGHLRLSVLFFQPWISKPSMVWFMPKRLIGLKYFGSVCPIRINSFVRRLRCFGINLHGRGFRCCCCFFEPPLQSDACQSNFVEMEINLNRRNLLISHLDSANNWSLVARIG